MLRAALLGLAPFVAYYRLWLSGPRAEHLFGDTNGQYWPDLVFFYRAFTHFQLPLWNPFERGGVSMLSEPEAGVLYPLNWLLAAFGAVLGGMPFVMIEIKACLHFAIGGVALFAWLRRRGLTASAAAIGGVVYELGPYTAGNAYFSLIWPQAWLPVLMLSADWLLEGGGALAAMATAAAGFLVVVAGSPPTAFYVALVALPYVGLRAVLVARREGVREWFVRTRGPLLLAMLLTALACYPSVRGTFEAMRASARAVRTFAYVSESPLPTREWLGLALRAASGVYVYIGLPSLMLAALGLTRWRARAEAALFGALGALGLLLMFGAATPVLHWFYDAVPPCRLFRICVRYVFLIQVAVSVLAAHGFAALSELRAPQRRVFFAASLGLPLAAGSVLVVAAMLRASDAPKLTEDLHWLLLGAAMTSAIALVTALWPRLSPSLGVAMTLVVAIDLGTMAHRAGVQHPGRFDAGSTVVSDEWVTPMKAEADADRIFGEFGLAWRPGPRLGLRDLRGYLVALVSQRLLDVYAQIGKTPQLLGLFNVRWLLHSGHPYHGLSHNFVKSADNVPGIAPRGGAVFEVEEPAPYAYWVQGARVEPTVASALARLADLDRHGELVLAEEDVGVVPQELRRVHAPREAATLESRTFSSMRFSVDAPAPGYLVVNETWFPGWKASVDDRAVPVLRGNVIMQALEVPAGKHVVELRFRPGYVLYPLGLALAAWLAALGWVVKRAVRRSRRHGESTPQMGSPRPS